ncbi:hypothetical protein Mapa_002842 [Marchantia paleacea]|nr:hypothetical protein Mapa_002842 [Marchantia paleacea]
MTTRLFSYVNGQSQATALNNMAPQEKSGRHLYKTSLSDIFCRIRFDSRHSRVGETLKTLSPIKFQLAFHQHNPKALQSLESRNAKQSQICAPKDPTRFTTTALSNRNSPFSPDRSSDSPTPSMSVCLPACLRPPPTSIQSNRSFYKASTPLTRTEPNGADKHSKLVFHPITEVFPNNKLPTHQLPAIPDPRPNSSSEISTFTPRHPFHRQSASPRNTPTSTSLPPKTKKKAPPSLSPFLVLRDSFASFFPSSARDAPK